MDRKSRKFDEKKVEKPKDSEDKTNLLVKVFEQLDIKDFIPNIRDRGDSTAFFGNKNSRHRNFEVATTKKHYSKEERKSVDISASELKNKKPNSILDLNDSSKEERQVKLDKEERRKAVESKKNEREKGNRTLFPTAKDIRKTKAEIKACTILELNPKSEIERLEDARKIDDKIKRINEYNRICEEPKTAKIKNLRLPPKDLKFIIENDALERRKLLRQRYTVKLKNSNKTVASKDSSSYNKYDDSDINNEPTEIFSNETRNESAKNILQLLETANLLKKTKEPSDAQRKAFIKTIRHNDHSVFKSVTFIDQKETTPLQIKMPNSKKSVETNTVKNKLKPIISKDSERNIAKEKTIHSRKEKKNERRLKKRPSSPNLAMFHGSPPQTEVAKWAPSCVTQDTKPYYEAWVDTTLAATSKISETDRLEYNTQHIFKTFKRVLELDTRPESPLLIYDKINDEKFRGKITVNKNRLVRNKV